MKTTKSTRYSPIRWSIGHAASEFPISAKTLAARLKSAGIRPAADGQFSTRQVCAAIYSDIHAERLKKLRLENRTLELEHQEKQGWLINLQHVFESNGRHLTAMRSRILGEVSVPRELQHELLTELHAIELQWAADLARFTPEQRAECIEQDRQEQLPPATTL